MPASTHRLMVVSPDAALKHRMEALFRGEAQVVWEPDIDQVLGRFSERRYEVMVLTSDAFRVGEQDGIDLLGLIGARSPETRILLLARDADIPQAIASLKAGNYQYARLPVSDQELGLLVRAALEQTGVGLEQGPLSEVAGRAEDHQFGEILGRSPAMEAVFRQVLQAAATDIPVLLQGETGTGKDLVARAIHRQSARRDQPFIPVNLGALPSELVGSELFGHERGAFTGATERREGKFELGHGGTVFLDEIDTIEERVQVSLLRLIEQKRFFRLGGKKLILADVRLVAATNENLPELVRTGRFREDLFFRLDVFSIFLPPLRERYGDFLLLMENFIQHYSQAQGKPIRGISPDCVELMESYDWPGNVRELKNVIQRAVLVCDGELLLPQHLPPRFRREHPVLSAGLPPADPGDQEPAPGLEAAAERAPVPDRGPAAVAGSAQTVAFRVGTPLEDVEREMILHTLQATENNRKQAARLLGISRRSFYNKLKKYNIS